MGRAPCCDENGLKKGPWTPEEDQKLVDYIQKHGHGSWRALPKNAGLQRCGKSCRLRWTNYLRPDIKRGKFSFEEEETILQLHAVLGNKWSAIAGRLPGRTDNEIKNYWNTHLKKRLLQMGIDPVTHRPRADLFAPSHLSHYFASLTHMTHWENSRLEAEARWLTNYLKLAAACRSSSSTSSGGSILNHPDIPNLGFEGLGNMNVDLLRSMSANDPMGWSMNNCPTLDMGNNQMFHASTNSGDNPSASNVGGSMVHLLDNMWQLALGAPSSSLLHATTDSCLSDETQLNNQANTGMMGYGKSIEEDIHEDVKNRFMLFQGRQPERVPLPPNNDNNVNAMWGVHDNKSGSLPPLVSESCSPCLNASFNDKSCEQHQSSNHNAPSESLLFEGSNQDMGGGMGSCSHHGDWVSEEEEGKEYWSHVLKFIDPETVPTGIEHIIRQD